MAQRPGGKIDNSKLKKDAKASKQTVAKAAAAQKAAFATLQARNKALKKVGTSESSLKTLVKQAKAAEAKVVKIDGEIKKIAVADAKLPPLIKKAKAAGEKKILVKLEDERFTLQTEMAARQKRREEEMDNLQSLGGQADTMAKEYYREVRQVLPDFGAPPPPPTLMTGWNAAFILAVLAHCVLAKTKLSAMR